MMKVMIVDDEYLAREGMKRTIDWKSLNCEICGEAKDGAEGIEVAKNTRPDLIITDISMPKINGLDMAKEIKEFIPECKFIVITGYDDFQYAKGAVKINAVDFILKPIDEEELISSIKKLSCEIIKNRERNFVAREKILLDILRGKIRGEEIEPTLTRYNINLMELAIICIENDYYEKALEKNDYDMLFSQNEYIKFLIDKNFNEYTHYFIECHENIFAVVINVEEYIENLEENIRQFYRGIKYVQEEFIEKYNSTITVGCSNIGKISDSKYIYEQSKQALKNKLYTGNGSINYYRELKKENILKWTYILNNEKEFRIAVKACDRRKIEKQLEKMYMDFFTNNHVSYSIIKQISIDLISIAIKILNEYNIAIENVMGKNFDIYRNIEKCKTISELYEWMAETVGKIVDHIKTENVSIVDSGIDKALEYIREHYCENISLRDVAQSAYLSESYISRKIKKVKGINFVDYITSLRMEKAIELLKNTNSKVSEVANEVGYSDYRYFSRTFKKYTGYSPRKFI